MGIDISIINALETVGCVNVGQLIGLNYMELKSVRGISDKLIVYLKNMLANHNIIWNITAEHDASNFSILISVPKNRVHDELCSVDFIYDVNAESVHIIKVKYGLSKWMRY